MREYDHTVKVSPLKWQYFSIQLLKILFDYYVLMYHY